MNILILKKWQMVKKNRIISLLIIGTLTLLTASCRKENGVTANSLDRLNWSERNYSVLSQFIQENGKGGKYNDEKKAPYAVFDWDQTCAHFDVEEAVMRYQLVNLRFKITKEQFRNELLKASINGVTKLSEAYKSVNLTDINADLASDYDFLYDHFLTTGSTMTLSSIQATPQYNDFIAKIPFLYDGFCETTGIGAEYGYPWLLCLLAGHTIEEVKALAKEAINYELGNKLGKQTWQSPVGFSTSAGVISYSYKTGLRVFPEIQNLISAFKSHGIDVFIVSASYKPIVEVFSGVGNYGYNVPSDHVIAMELATSGDGRILPQYKPGWIITQRQGKVDAINRVIKQELGKNCDPLFSAGDSDGDYEMSTMFPEMKLTLIWNRVKGGDIGKLCKQAVEESKLTAPRYILQGRNENTGIVMPCSESILLGKTEPQLLY